MELELKAAFPVTDAALVQKKSWTKLEFTFGRHPSKNIGKKCLKHIFWIPKNRKKTH